NYIQNKKLGFDKSQVLILNDAYALGDKAKAFKEEMLKVPSVEKVTVSSYLPVPSSRSDETFTKSRIFSSDNAVNMQKWLVDLDYLASLGTGQVGGCNFDLALPSDSNAVILKVTVVKFLGLENTIDKKSYTLDGLGVGTPIPEYFRELT